ncbi:MAG: cyanoexosortase A [Cyanophyceae cyanobacterium]
MNWSKLRTPQYWLLAIATALATLQLTAVLQADDAELLSMSALFWLTISSLLWDKRKQLNLNSGRVASLLGAGLIAFVLLRTLSPDGYNVRILPFISGCGLALLASGIKQVYQYWKELVVLSLFGVVSVLSLILRAIDLPTITAQFSTFVLWAAGFRVYRQGVLIVLPTGRVEVWGACSGIENIIQMFSVAVLFLLLISLPRWQQFLCLIVAVLLGFIVNAGRVALLAVLVASAHTEAFEYWHGGSGSLFFSMMAVLLFGIFCWLVFFRDPPSELEGQ